MEMGKEVNCVCQAGFVMCRQADTLEETWSSAHCPSYETTIRQVPCLLVFLSECIFWIRIFSHRLANVLTGRIQLQSPSGAPVVTGPWNPFVRRLNNALFDTVIVRCVWFKLQNLHEHSTNLIVTFTSRAANIPNISKIIDHQMSNAKCVLCEWRRVVLVCKADTACVWVTHNFYKFSEASHYATQVKLDIVSAFSRWPFAANCHDSLFACSVFGWREGVPRFSRRGPACSAARRSKPSLTRGSHCSSDEHHTIGAARPSFSPTKVTLFPQRASSYTCSVLLPIAIANVKRSINYTSLCKRLPGLITAGKRLCPASNQLCLPPFPQANPSTRHPIPPSEIQDFLGRECSLSMSFKSSLQKWMGSAFNHS